MIDARVCRAKKVSSDHYVVKLKLKFNLKRTKKESRYKLINIDQIKKTHSLKNYSAKKFVTLKEEKHVQDLNVGVICGHLKDVVTEATESALGRKPRKGKKNG